ncbi:MAG: Coq4 family protein [Myxococcota bacterium]
MALALRRRPKKQLPEKNRPTWLFRMRKFFYHGGKVLFFKYPGFTLQDLAAVQDSVDGPSFTLAAQRMWDHPVGRRLMIEQPEITLDSVDWRALSMLPIDSLGYNFWHHMYTNGILQDVDFSNPVVKWDEDTEYAKKRYRETHDIRHVVLGLSITGPEEAILQSFQCSQLYQHLSLGIMTLGALKFALSEGSILRMLRDEPRAWRVGKEARFLSNVYYEHLWERPVAEVREMLNITPIGDRYPVKERHPDAPWERPSE